jgi:hypothetical protein
MEDTMEEEKVSSVSREEFDSLKEEVTSGFREIVGLIKAKPEEKVKMEVEEKKVAEASSDVLDVNPRYHAKALEVLGEKLGRTYVTYPKGGGTLFTIVINEKFSNAPKDYLERYKEDKRTVNLEREEFRGEEGAEKWAKLVLQNLNRTLR